MDPPLYGSVKFNVDAGLSREEDLCAIMMVCRDHNGTYLGSSALVIQGLSGLPSLEAIACRKALSLADDLGIQNLLVASQDGD